MFESLSNRLQGVFRSIRGQSRLTEDSVDAALHEIRLALLEADVNFRVVKAFVERVRSKAVGDEVLRSLTPDQHVVRIVRDEMLALFGTTTGGLSPATRSPRVVLMLGLQGSGKTTSAAKLARWLEQQGRHPMLVSTDVRRPAAIEQLSVLAKQVGARVHEPVGEMDPVARAAGALAALVVDRRLRPLDEGEDVAHAEQPGHEPIGLERLEILRPLAEADKRDRHADNTDDR